MLNTSLFSVLVHEQAKRYGDKTAMSYRDYEKNVWVPVSWNRFSEVVRKVSASLLALGVDVQENLAVFRRTCPNVCTWISGLTACGPSRYRFMLPVRRARWFTW